MLKNLREKLTKLIPLRLRTTKVRTKSSVQKTSKTLESSAYKYTYVENTDYPFGGVYNLMFVNRKDKK